MGKTSQDTNKREEERSSLLPSGSKPKAGSIEERYEEAVGNYIEKAKEAIKADQARRSNTLRSLEYRNPNIKGEELKKEADKYVEIGDSIESNKEIYNANSTIRRRFRDIWRSSSSRLRKSAERFAAKKAGTCWETAQATDYHLKNKPRHHIIAFKTSSIAAHTFNCYGNNDDFYITDIFKCIKDFKISDYNTWKEYIEKADDIIPKCGCDEWYVMSQVNRNEWYKRLGMKRWAKFCTKTESEGGFVIINDDAQTFKRNDPNQIK